MRINLILFILLMFLISGCTSRSTCFNENQLFDQYDYRSSEYKKELISRLKKGGAYQYWFQKIEKNEIGNVMVVDIQGEGLCAKTEITMLNPDTEIANLIHNNGRGYRGAELKGLKFKVIQDSANIQLLYQGISGIRD